ncbi:MAG: bifunctional aldolase/short-chain dehydrogenase [Rhodobacter sp.]|nr:bifunctional aldolase/short-chain dehydrogenase [Rhodobacter sp.]MCY4168050.1 bifunctional aldolase/short-chain dehydrogenase [Rhodobacter sp.]MCY4243154.1 bifunctional aldolase/short-chain dehydrogenase [Rhodobacter sp.]
MLSRWCQSDLNAMIRTYADDGIHEDLAIRTYTTRLLGQDPALVLHGGGNTSVKTKMTDMLGATLDVLCVKGSGWDMGTIEPPGLPAVELEPLASLARLEALSDRDLVAAQRRMLLDPHAPNPSIEAVLHAMLPFRHVDHTHANAIVSLTNQPDGESIIRDLFPDTTIVPYVFPGFLLAKACHDILASLETVHSLVLLKHGIFTFNDDPRQSYEDMIAMCAKAGNRLEAGIPRPFSSGSLPANPPGVAEFAPILRGALARDTEIEGRPDRWILNFRTSGEIRHFVDGEDLNSYATRGNATPDHSIRIKRFGMVSPAPEAGRLDEYAAGVVRSVTEFADDYHAYFERNNARVGGGRKCLDPVPRVIYVPGIGLFGVGRTEAEAMIAADVAEATVNVITRAEGIGTFESLGEEDLFDIEYWSLEQAKLSKASERPLHRQVAVVTGAAGGLGLEAARLLKEDGAEVAMLDVDADALQGASDAIGGGAFVCDVTDETAVRSAIDAVVERYGGLDILVSNAGAAYQGRLIDVDEDVFRRAHELNFWSHQYLAKACVRVMEMQGTGGALLFNVSKQALNPGAGLGPYGTSKAALLALVRQYAIEHGASGITSNAVNADRIRTNLLTEEFVRERAAARGITPAEYMRGNLVRREVTGRDVAEAFLHLAKARKTSGAILTVDGGNVAAMVR